MGTHAARIALGLGAQVTILDISAKRLAVLEDVFGHQIQTLMSNPFNIEASVRDADVVIGAVLIPGAKAPKLVTDDMVKQMRPGSVIVDVAVDQGGVIETADRVTTHTEPVYETWRAPLCRCQYPRGCRTYLYYRPYQCDPSLC